MVRTIGVEEELLLIDPETREIGSRSPQVLKEFREHGAGREPAVAADDLDRELFRHQVEIRTRPETDLAEIRAEILAARRHAAEAAAAAGLATVASGIVPCGGMPLQVTDDDRYRQMVETFGRIATYGGTCGMHVHVGGGLRRRGGGRPRPDRALAPGPGRDRRQLALPRRGGHRVRLVAHRELEPVAQRRGDRAVRDADGLPEGLPLPDGFRRAP